MIGNISQSHTALTGQVAVADQLFMPVQARIVKIQPQTALEKLFTIELPDGLSLGHRPGQFVEVSVLGVGEAPISISSSPSRSNGRFATTSSPSSSATSRATRPP